MTMPHLMNCGHSDDGWCLDCVKAQWEELDALRAEHDVTLAEIDDLKAHIADLERERDEARAILDRGEASDGHHTHRELYEYRMLYNAHAAHGWLAAGVPVVKSHLHSDGEPCFGGRWFIVVAALPSGQVSNHYRDEHWGLFNVPVVDKAPTYDGHTPADAAIRLRESLSAIDFKARNAALVEAVEGLKEVA